MKKEINFVVCCYAKHNKLHGKKLFPFSTIKNFLPIWCTTPTETISIRTYYQDAHLLPDDAMPSAVDINLKKLTVAYKVRLVANKYKYRNYKVTYSCLEDLVYSVMNYLDITQETTMVHSDILTSGEN